MRDGVAAGGGRDQARLDMKNVIIVAAVVGFVAPVLPVWAAEASSAPAGEMDLSACLADPPGLAGRLEAQLADLNKAEEAADTPLDQAAANLATANWLIAVPGQRGRRSAG